MAFLDENYLLTNPSAVDLFNCVKELPIIDAHNHGDVKEILENKGWEDIWEVEAATDHYVWELMRKRGVPEGKITGQASNEEKWTALAGILPECAGNPVYEWIHLDLKRRFDIHEPISTKNAKDVWDKTQDLLKKAEMKPQALLKEMKVEIMCTTDPPTSDLKEHQQAKKQVKDVQILPTWRPDKLMNVQKKEWKENVELLGKFTDTDITSLTGLMEAAGKSHDHFEKNGCVASDHGILEPLGKFVKEKDASAIYDKALGGNELDTIEWKKFMSFMMCLFGRLNQESGWVTQIHIGAMRDYRSSLWNSLGPDSGGDISTNALEIAGNLKYFLNQFAEEGKVVLYCLDPTHLPTLATIARAFPNISLGAPWWLNDSPFGMEQHIKYMATIDLLSNHAGMVTDSRKLMSYGSRTEMFRRVLCNAVGDMEQKGQLPLQVAKNIVRKVSYERPLELFFNR